jgi:oligopeptidase A
MQKKMQWNNIKISELISSIGSEINNYKNIITDLSESKNLNLIWANLIQPLENAKANLDAKVNIMVHLHSVQDNKELREAYSYILPKLSDLQAELLQNNNLYQKIIQFKQSLEFYKLDIAQQKIIENLLLDFKLSGVDLSLKQQQKYKLITKNIGELSDQFSKNVLDATHNWHYHIDLSEQNKLNGLPEHIIDSIKKDENNGWDITLDFPVVDGVLRYALDRELRNIVYKANITKASEFTKEFDNTKIMHDIIKLRAELASLLGFNNYSEYSLAHKMANTTEEVINFLEEIADLAVPIARQEFLNITNFAKQQDNLDQLEPWDIAFYSEKYKKHLFNLSDEELRSYFPKELVLSGIFKLANNLFGITVQEELGVETWDQDVKFYKVLDLNNNLRGFFYTDLYVRANKKSGAWMAECLSRHKNNGQLQHPIAFLVTNFAKSNFLYHEEVLTLLHEFGHTLHHVLTQVDYISAAGCAGVSWDAVELPSQFMEKWGYNFEFLQTISSHKDTKEKLSKTIFDSLINIKNYNAGMFMVRQLEFAMFDFKLHMENSSNIDIQNILNQVRSKISVVPIAKYNRFQHGFSHIFAGGYAAGYYSYSWAEVLAVDAFMAFKDNDIKIMGAKFLNNILEMGGAKNAMDLYILFRGKKPDVRSLLEYKGLIK